MSSSSISKVMDAYSRLQSKKFYLIREQNKALADIDKDIISVQKTIELYDEFVRTGKVMGLTDSGRKALEGK